MSNPEDNFRMPVEVERLLVSTADMTSGEFGSYFRLLCYQWMNKGIRPNRLPCPVSDEEWEEIKHKFELCDDDKLRNKRTEKIRAEVIEQRIKLSNAGKKAAAKRWHSDGDASAVQDKDIGKDISNPKETDRTNAPAVNHKSGSQPKPYKDRVNEYFDSIDQEQRSIWAEAYPNVDLDNEFRKAKGWLLTNTNKAKSNFKRFLNSWLSRAMDKSKSTATTYSKADMPDHMIPGSAAEKRWLKDHGIGERTKI